jgi:hypothetical protein
MCKQIEDVLQLTTNANAPCNPNKVLANALNLTHKTCVYYDLAVQDWKPK